MLKKVMNRKHATCIALSIGLVTMLPVGLITGTEIIESKTLRLVILRADSATWRVDRDGLDDDGDPKFALDHRASGGDLSVTAQESASQYQPPSHAAFWRLYVQGARQRLTVFKEVSIPANLTMPRGFECSAAEQTLGKRDGEVTHITCTAGRGKTHVLLHLWLPKDYTRKQYAAHVNDLLATVALKR